MLPLRSWLILALIVSAWCCADISFGQADSAAKKAGPTKPRPSPNADTPNTKSRSQSPSAKQAGEPESSVKNLSDAGQAPLFYFFTRDNELVLASNIKYEDIQEFYNLKQGLRQQAAAPKYAVRSVDIRGTVRNDVADLTLKFEIEVIEDAPRAIAAPLGLGGLVRPNIQYQGDGKQFVVFDGHEYVCWIAAKANSRHTLTVKAMAPVDRFEDAFSLSLDLPYAPSKIQLEVPVPRATITLSDRRSTIAIRRNGSKSTQATIDSRGGALEIRWLKANAPQRNLAPLVFADTTLNVRVDNPLLLHIDADVEVRAARGELSEFSIRLPPGLKLLEKDSRPNGGFVVSEPIAGADANAGSLVRIQLDKPAQRAPRIRLTGEITLKPSEVGQPIQVWGFEVIDAHQTGNIALISGDDWVVTPTEGKSVRRDRSLPAGAVRAPKGAARFSVVNQPCSLQISIRPKATRVIIDPTYQLDISPTKTDLEIRLLCRFGNGRPLDLDLPLQGWTVKQLLPQRLVPAGGEFEIENGNLTIPLAKVSDAPMGDAEIVIRLEVANMDDDAMSLPLPMPQVSQFSPGLSLVMRAPLVVAGAANNVQLTPDMSQMPNLATENIERDSLPEDLQSRQQPPFAFRGETSNKPLVFHVAKQIRPRSVVATPTATFEFAKEAISVKQDVRLDVSYETLAELRFDAQSIAANPKDIQVRLDQLELPVRDADETGFTVVFPEPMIGSFSLTIEYSLPLPELRPETTQTLTVPLASPQSIDLKSTPPVVRCLYPDHLRLDLPEDSSTWSTESAVTIANDRLEKKYAASDAAASCSFVVGSAEVVSGSITVERMWVQSWLTSVGRKDHATFHVSTPNPRLSLYLPKGAALDAEKLTISADGYRIDDREFNEQLVEFALPETASKNHLIEIWYEFPDSRSKIGAIDFEMPNVESASRVNEFYWELITPRKEHLLSHPEEMTAEMRWRRRGFTYGREALLSPMEMAELSGAALKESPAPRDANRYLFSSIGAIRRVQAHTIRRSWLVVIVAGGVMGLGFLWLSLRGNGRSVFFLVAAVIIGGLATVFPNPAVLIAQAGFLGMGFLCLGRLLKWAFWHNRSIGVDVRGIPQNENTNAHTVREARLPQPATTQIHAPSESGV